MDLSPPEGARIHPMTPVISSPAADDIDPLSPLPTLKRWTAFFQVELLSFVRLDEPLFPVD